MEERCIVCGEVIPEGRQFCPCCDNDDTREIDRLLIADIEKSNNIVEIALKATQIVEHLTDNPGIHARVRAKFGFTEKFQFERSGENT